MDTSEWEEQVELLCRTSRRHVATIGRLQNEAALEENLPALEQEAKEFKANSERRPSRNSG